MTPWDALLRRLRRWLSGRPPERRASPRQPSGLRAYWRAQPAGAADRPRRAFVHDVSRSGIALRTGGPPEPGARLVVGVPVGSGRGRRLLEVKVVRVAASPSGGWLAGCAFLQQLTEAELQAFLP
jgi:hypothetical protein